MPDHKADQEFSLKSLFIPLTTVKAIHFYIIIGLVVYGNMLFNSFVADDITLIVQNQTIHSFSSLFTLLFQSYGNVTGAGVLTGSYYVPLTLIFLSLLYSLFGAQPFFFHFAQLSLHIANASLLYLLFSSFYSNRLAFFLALVFLVHPITQETVGYIANMQDTLYLFFGLLAFYLFKKSQDKKIVFKTYTLIALLLFLSLLSKVTGILFIVVLFFWIVMNKRRDVIRFGLLSAAVLFTYYLFKAFATNVAFEVEPSLIGRVEPFIRMITIPKILFYYIFTFFYPATLLTHQDWIVREISVTDFHLPLIIVISFFVAIGIFGYVCFKKSMQVFYVFLLFSLWFFIGLLLHSQIFPLDFTVTDRWFYFPLVGLLGLSGLVIQKIKIQPKILFAVGCITIVLLSIRTMVRNENWRTGYTLYSHDLKYAGNNAYLNALLGNELMTLGKYDESIIYFTIASQLYPTESKNYLNLSAAYYLKGDLKQTEQFLFKAIAMDNTKVGYERLGTLYIKENKLHEAKQVIEKGIIYNPKYQKLHLYLAYCEYKLNNKEQALNVAKEAFQLAPTHEAQYVLQQISNGQEIIFQ
jgi:hypothetical protein